MSDNEYRGGTCVLTSPPFKVKVGNLASQNSTKNCLVWNPGVWRAPQILLFFLKAPLSKVFVKTREERNKFIQKKTFLPNGVFLGNDWSPPTAKYCWGHICVRVCMDACTCLRFIDTGMDISLRMSFPAVINYQLLLGIVRLYVCVCRRFWSLCKPLIHYCSTPQLNSAPRFILWPIYTGSGVCSRPWSGIRVQHFCIM